MKHKLISFDLVENTVSTPTDEEQTSLPHKLDKIKPILRAVISDALTQRQKQVCIMYFYRNMRVVDISECLSVNKSTVSRTLTRALKNINDRVKYYA